MKNASPWSNEWGGQHAGKRRLLQHLRGKRLTQRQAIVAKCYECMGYNGDGRGDCRLSHFPLYPFMPYRKDAEAEDGAEVEAKQVV